MIIDGMKANGKFWKDLRERLPSWSPAFAYELGCERPMPWEALISESRPIWVPHVVPPLLVQPKVTANSSTSP